VKFQDYYAILGVAREASREEIQRAYRKLARKHHPDVDKTPGATQRFAQLAEAYEVLKDEKKRQRYDTLGARWKDGEEVPPPSGWRESHFEPGADRGTFEGFDFGGANGFSSFFEAFFGGAGGDVGDPFARGSAARGASGARRRSARAGGSIEARLEIDLEDAYAGATRTITLQSDGSDGPGERARTYDVKIPPGTTHGTTIRLRGQGGAGLGGGPPGDLLLHIEIRPHPRFTVQDHDLSTLLPVSPWEAALGAKIGIRTLDGGEVVLAVPPGSSSGKKLRMRRMGLPLGPAERGDLIVELRIVVPESLTDAERKAFEELARASKFEPRKG
jgi:curved DNA-binding protein